MVQDMADVEWPVDLLIGRGRSGRSRFRQNAGLPGNSMSSSSRVLANAATDTRHRRDFALDWDDSSPYGSGISLDLDPPCPNT